MRTVKRITLHDGEQIRIGADFELSVLITLCGDKLKIAWPVNFRDTPTIITRDDVEGDDVEDY